MKSKKIDFTDDYDDLIFVIGLARFLDKLQISSADDLEHIAINMHENNFCDRCEYRKENCECYSEGSYMREYDDGADYED